MSNMNFNGMVNGLIQDIGKENTETYVKQHFGEDASLNMLNEIVLGDSKGWADPLQQWEFLQYVLSCVCISKSNFRWTIS